LISPGRAFANAHDEARFGFGGGELYRMNGIAAFVGQI